MTTEDLFVLLIVFGPIIYIGWRHNIMDQMKKDWESGKLTENEYTEFVWTGEIPIRGWLDLGLQDHEKTT